MGFLAPLFLFGGLLVSLPIILHLTRRQRQPIAFPSLLFLKRMGPSVRYRRRRIRNLPLLLLRSFALLLLALAFARPLLESGVAVHGTDPPRDVAVLVDRSLSMRIGDRADAAREAAAEVLASLGPADRAVVVAFDDRPEALTRLTEDREALARAVEDIVPGEAGTRFPSALGFASRLVPATPGRRREVVLISDLQRNGFDDGRPDQALPEGTGARVVGVGTEPASWGAWVSSVSLAPEGRDGLVATARIGFLPGPAGEPVEVEAALWLAGRVVERQRVRLEGGRSHQAGTVRFAPFVRPTDPLEAAVRISGPRPDWLPDDDVFRLGVVPDDALRVRVLGETVSVHLREALRVGASPAFLLESGPARGEAAVRDALAGVRIAVSTDPGRLDEGAVKALVDHVEAGGALVLGMGPARLRADLGELLPVRLGEARERFPPARLGNLLGRHPVFAPFAGGGGVTAALSSAAFHRYRQVVGEPPEETVLARFDDGNPALLAFERAAGRVAVVLSSLDPSWNDLARRPAFVPFVHELLAWAARFEEIPIAWRVGQIVDPETAFRLGPVEDRGVVIREPSGETGALGAGATLRLDAAGVWGARHPEGDAFRMLAANPSPAELDPVLLDPEEIRMAIVMPERPPTDGEGEDSAAVRPPAAGVPLEWPLLLAVALLLLSEGVVATGGLAAWRRRRARGSGTVPVLPEGTSQ